MAQNDIQAAMYYYIDLGLPIIPLCTADEHEHEKTSPGHQKICKCRGKIPLIAGWQSRKETKEEDVKNWITQFKTLNVGLPLGEASGYVGIDVDGSEGEEILLAMSGGDLPETWEFTTGDGRRLLYSIPVGLPTKKVKQTGEGPHTECAILCTGQQTVLPPSQHFTGKEYQWKVEHSPYDIDCSMAPKWLIDMVRYDVPQKGIATTNSAPTKYAADMINMASEFELADFDEYIPDDLLHLQQTEVKKQSGKRANEPDPAIEAMLYQVIEEGSRDDSMTKIIGHFLSKAEYRHMPKEFFIDFVHNYNQKYCDPPLDDDAILVKVEHFWELEAQKTSMYKGAKSTKEWVIAKVIQMLLNKFSEANLVIKFDKAKRNYYYCNTMKGPWVEDVDGIIEGLVWSYIKDPLLGDPSWGSQHKLNEAMDALELELRSRGYSRRQLFDMNIHKDELANHIVVDGKLLSWRTGELLPWDTNYNTTINFDVGYDPKATCPHWDNYMKDWLPDELTRDLLQEFMGSCLLPEPAPEEKFIILTGSGSNGKTMFLKGMQMIFRAYSISLTPQKLSERFGPSSLYGKLINICSEIEGDGGYLKNTAQLKAIVSGEPLTAEYKGQDAFQFEPVANLIFSCNTVPKTKDKTAGWYRRQLIIPFNRTFAPNSVIGYEMVKNMSEEIPGIFNWLLEGLKRVKLRGRFIMSDDLIQVQADFKAVNDPIEGFIADCLRPATEKEICETAGFGKPDLGISTTIILELYNSWCKYSYGDKDVSYRRSPRAFNLDLESKNYHKVRGTCMFFKNKTSVFQNLLIDIKNTELYQVIEDEYMGCSVIEPGYYLREIVRKKKAEEHV